MTADALTPLRITALLTSWCGLVALVAASMLSPALAVVAAVLTTIACTSFLTHPSASARQVRKSLHYAVLLIALAFVAMNFGAGGDVSALAGSLPPLLIGVVVAQGLSADKRHDLMVSVTVSQFMLVLAAGISPSPSVALPLLLGWLLAIVALVQSHQAHATDCSAPALRSSAPRSGRWLPPAAVAAALSLAIGLLAFLVIPTPPERSAQRRLRAALGDLSMTGEGGRAGHLSGESMDMRTRGDLGNRPVAEVPDDSPQLWRNGIFDTFDGTRWTRASASGLAIVGLGRVRLPPDPLDQNVAPAGVQRTDEVRALAGFDAMLMSPGTPVSVTTPGRVAAMGAARILLEERSDFVVTSVLPNTDADQLAAASGEDLGGPWLQLPGQLPARVGVLAEQLAGTAPSRPAAVAAIAQHLSRSKTYDLDSAVPPEGVDAVDYFLFDSTSGFCEQFAAAQVVMLRSLGIPARMAVGYGYGKQQGNDRRLFTSGNAHAWVEVWYPGIGWSPSDPTPASAQNRGDRPTNVFERFVQWVQRQLSSSRGRWVLAAILLVIVGVGFVIVWWRRRRTRRYIGGLRTSPAAIANTLLAAFARLEAALAADGRPRAPAETIAELERRIGTDLVGRRALQTLELALYSPNLVTPQDARSAAHAFDALAASILAAHAARERLADSIGVRR